MTLYRLGSRHVSRSTTPIEAMSDTEQDFLTRKNEPRGGSNPVRKSYQVPRLTRYGDVQTLTRTSGKTGSNDGGGGKTKSQP